MKKWKRVLIVGMCTLVLSFSVISSYQQANEVKAFDLVITPVIAWEVLSTLLGVLGITIGGTAVVANRDAIVDSILDYGEREYEMTRKKYEQQGDAWDTWNDFIGKAYDKGKITIDDKVKPFIDNLVNNFSYATALPSYKSLDYATFAGSDYPYVVVTTDFIDVFNFQPLFYNTRSSSKHILAIEGLSGALALRRSLSGEVETFDFSRVSFFYQNKDFIYSNFPCFNSYDVAFGNYGLWDTSDFVDFDPLNTIKKKLEELDTKVSDITLGSLNDVGEFTNDIPLVDPRVWEDVANGDIPWDKVIEDNKVIGWDPATDKPIIGDMPVDKPVDPDNPTKPDPDNPTVPDVGMGGFLADLTTLFPFCIPFDLVRAFSVLASDGDAPVYKIPFKIDYGDFHVEQTWQINMSDYESVVIVFRLLETLTFIITLIVVTRALIKG